MDTLTTKTVSEILLMNKSMTESKTVSYSNPDSEPRMGDMDKMSSKSMKMEMMKELQREFEEPEFGIDEYEMPLENTIQEPPTMNKEMPEENEMKGSMPDKEVNKSLNNPQQFLKHQKKTLCESLEVSVMSFYDYGDSPMSLQK